MSEVKTFEGNTSPDGETMPTLKYIPVLKFAGLMMVYDDIPWVYNADTYEIIPRDEAAEFREIPWDNQDIIFDGYGWVDLSFIALSQIVSVHDKIIPDEENVCCCYCELTTADGSTYYIADLWEHLFKGERM